MNSIYVNSHIISSHELLVTMRTRYRSNSSSFRSYRLVQILVCRNPGYSLLSVDLRGVYNNHGAHRGIRGLHLCVLGLCRVLSITFIRYILDSRNKIRLSYCLSKTSCKNIQPQFCPLEVIFFNELVFKKFGYEH